ncbi:hypothetical protein [Arthrobacter sp. PsM3]|uniref:hypothetical protein n=1 Tax=Arthrobacter sp. PsM3 TaxID=3030531 RepID=UPI00263A5CFF|nr:hypothetical protein [Arthrobacter sp. PsM3]MDN4645976.1 hypothetical protein [Arthrobacter sp. PsM3]
MKYDLNNLGDQGMQIDPEEGHERPEENGRQAFENVAGNILCLGPLGTVSSTGHGAWMV